MQPTVLEPKRGTDVGRVVVDVVVQNAEDFLRSERGELSAEQIRSVNVKALVDTGATFLCLPEAVVSQLGLPFVRDRETRSISGPMTMKIHGPVRIEVEGRDCIVEVMAIPEGRQALLGQIPLDTLDYWVDVTNHRLVGNPEHDGEWMAEVY